MSIYCPLGANEYGTMPRCAGGNCGLADNAGECLIKQALQHYIQDKQEERAAREAIANTSLGGLFNDFFGATQKPKKESDNFDSVKTSEPATGVGY
jgi:hypothetical protein